MLPHPHFRWLFRKDANADTIQTSYSQKIPMPSIPSLETYFDLNDWNQDFICEFIRYSTSKSHQHFSEPDNPFTLSSTLPSAPFKTETIFHYQQPRIIPNRKPRLDPCPSVPPQIDQHKECPKNRAHTSTQSANNSSPTPNLQNPRHHNTTNPNFAPTTLGALGSFLA